MPERLTPEGARKIAEDVLREAGLADEAEALRDGIERGWLTGDCTTCAHSVPCVGIDDLVCDCEGMDASWWDYELLNRPVCRLYQRPGMDVDD